MALIPAVVRRSWHWWSRFGQEVANYQARLLLTFVYFFPMALFGILVRLLQDPLQLKGTARGPRWHRRAPGDRTLTESRRQW